MQGLEEVFVLAEALQPFSNNYHSDRPESIQTSPQVQSEPYPQGRPFTSPNHSKLVESFVLTLNTIGFLKDSSTTQCYRHHCSHCSRHDSCRLGPISQSGNCFVILSLSFLTALPTGVIPIANELKLLLYTSVLLTFCRWYALGNSQFKG